MLNGDGGETLDGQCDLELRENTAYETLGRAVSGAMDLDNDGHPDVLVGAPNNQSEGMGTGSAYMYLGGPGMDARPDAVYLGPLYGESFATSVSVAGDVDGDGFNETFFGSPQNCTFGQNVGTASVFGWRTGLRDPVLAVGGAPVWTMKGFFNGTAVSGDFSSWLQGCLSAGTPTGNDAWGNGYVFPAPFGPSRPNIRPGRHVKETPSTARNSPPRLGSKKILVRPSASITPAEEYRQPRRRLLALPRARAKFCRFPWRETPMAVAALAFSGGLDTSFAVLALIREGYDVVTVTVDTGGFTPAQLSAIAQRARAVGAKRHVAVDAKQEVFDRFFSYILRGNVLTGAASTRSRSGPSGTSRRSSS